MKRIILILSAICALSLAASAQDTRERTVETTVQDALAQMPSQDYASYLNEMEDLAQTAPESVKILAGMLVPASEGQNNLLEYALSGLTQYVATPATSTYKSQVKEGLMAGLASCKDVPNKAFLMSQLQVLATADDVPAIAEYLDGDMAEYALAALMLVPEGDKVIMSRIAEGKGCKEALASAAAQMGMTEAEPYIQAWAEEDGKDVYYAALAQCGTKASLPVLEGKHEADYVVLVDRLAQAGDISSVAAAAKKLAKSENSAYRCASVRYALIADPAKAPKTVVAALKDDDIAYRNAALQNAPATEEVYAAIAKKFKSFDDAVKVDVIKWFGNNKAESQIDLVLASFGGKTSEAAIEAAGKIGGEKAVKALMDEIACPSHGKDAFRALLSIDDCLIKEVTDRLQKSTVPAEQIALMKLADTKSMEAASARIFELCASENPQVKAEAVVCLDGVVTAADSDKVAALLNKAEDAEEIADLQKALSSTLKTLANADRYTKVKELMAAAPSQERYFPALAYSATNEAVSDLESYCKAGQASAFASLLKTNNYKAADALLRVAGNDQDKKEKIVLPFVSLVNRFEKSIDRKCARYEQALALTDVVKNKNSILKSLANVPTMKAFLLAGKYFDDKDTEYQAAKTAKTIATTTKDDIDYDDLQTILKKALAVFKSKSGADDGYAVDEITKILNESKPSPVVTLSPEEIAQGWELLFDGKDLSKWTGDMDGYTPVNGTIYVTANYGNSRNLYTKKEYKDFIFRFEFCFIRNGVNNGVGIRTPMGVDAAYHGMCEVQILDHDAPIYKNLRDYQVHGSVYGIVPAKRIVHKPLGEWSTQEIKVVGDRVTVTVNGEVILDADVREACQGHNVAPDGDKRNPYTVDKKNHPGLFNEKGHVGFLGHGAGVKFRNVRILEL